MRTPVVVAVLAGLMISPHLAAQPRASGPLTAEQVLCEEQLLDRLERRAALEGFGASNLFFWRSSASGGQFQGLGLRCWFCSGAAPGTRFEELLSFDLRLDSGLDRLSPMRPLIPQASLSRRDAASNRIEADRLSFVAFLTLDLAPGSVDPLVAPVLPLRISNQAGSQFGHADAPGRGIVTDRLTEVCHTDVTELDEKIFLVLSRTMRVDQSQNFGGGTAGGTKGTIFRSREPLHYRVNLVSYGASECGEELCYGENGPIALELSFEQNDAGQLTTGTARVLPVCTGDLREEPPGCTSQDVQAMKIYFLPPLTPGVETQSPEVVEAAPFLIWKFSLSDDNVTETAIDWAALLANTAWNGGS